MDILIQSARIIDPASAHHGQNRDILIQDGVITGIAASIETETSKIIQAEGLCVSVGWMDIGAQTCDPGLEHREDLMTATKAAAAGGYTHIACFPNTEPALHSKAQVQYVIKNTPSGPVKVWPIGAVTMGCQGKDITEIYDMQRSGAVAFSDGSRSITDNGMMLRALLYVKPFGGLIINHPHDKATAHSGQMHEGFTSTSLGMKGIPSLSEELMLYRDLKLLAYTESRLHVQNISTAGAVRLIREAKAAGLPVTASVAALNLVYDDTALEEFDTYMKVLPPLRESHDCKALLQGLADGTIDAITSNHCPWDAESKDMEFLYAEFGAMGLETAFSLAYPALKETLGLEKTIALLNEGPRRILNMPQPRIAEGQTADLTIFQPDEEWVWDKVQSKARNSHLLGQKLSGKVLGVVNGIECAWK